MIILISGEEKCGKSTTMMTARKPLVVFDFDTLGSVRALRRFRDIRHHIWEYPKCPAIDFVVADITIVDCPAPLQLDPIKRKGYQELWQYFQDRYAWATMSPEVQTVAIDTLTMYRPVAAEAYLQTLQAEKPRMQLSQPEYGEPNNRVRRLLARAKSARKDLILVCHLQDERVDSYDPDTKRSTSVLTGRKNLGTSVMAELPRQVDVQINNERRLNGNLPVMSIVVVCGLGLEAVGLDAPPILQTIFQTIADATGDELEYFA